MQTSVEHWFVKVRADLETAVDAMDDEDGCDDVAWRGRLEKVLGKAWHGLARVGKAWQGLARVGKAWH